MKLYRTGKTVCVDVNGTCYRRNVYADIFGIEYVPCGKIAVEEFEWTHAHKVHCGSVNGRRSSFFELAEIAQMR